MQGRPLGVAPFPFRRSRGRLAPAGRGEREGRPDHQADRLRLSRSDVEDERDHPAPPVMPSSRAIASIPPAAPDRVRGAAASMVRLFGAWKKPKPKPQRAIQTR